MIKYKGATLKIYNVLVLKMDMEDLSYKQQLHKVNVLCTVLHTLSLRKRPGLNIWEMWVGGKWIDHTSIVLYE